jgi:hypothetical protein
LCGAANGTLGKVDWKYRASFEMWSWKMMEIAWTDRVKNEEVLHGVKEYPTDNKKEGRLTELITSCLGTAF